MSMTEASRDRAIGLGIGVLALALRVIRWAQTPVMFNDGPVFIYIGRAMGRGDWSTALAADQHPLYPLLTMLAQRALGNWELAGAVVSIVAGTLAVVFLYALLRDAFDRQVAWIGALLLAVHPYAITYAADVQSDAPYLAAFVGALALLWKALDRRSGWLAAAAGLVAGLAYLVRPEGAGVVLVGLGVVALETARQRWPVRTAAPWAVALGLGAVLAMGPYIALLSAHHGTLTFSQKKSIQELLGLESFQEWIRVPELRSEPAPPPFRVAGLLAATGGVDEGYPRLRAASQLVQTSTSAARYETVLLILLGAWALRGPLSLRGRFTLVALGLYAFVLYALVMERGYVSRRHTLPVAVVLLGYAGAGVPVLGRGLLLASRRLARVPREIRMRHAIAVGLSIAVVVSLAKGFRPHRLNAVAERRAAEWLRERGTQDHAVAAGKERVAFYADAEFVRLRPTGNGPRLLELEQRGVGYIVVDTDERQELLALNGDDAARLRLLHEEQAHGYTAFVYELVAPQAAQILE